MNTRTILPLYSKSATYGEAVALYVPGKTMGVKTLLLLDIFRNQKLLYKATSTNYTAKSYVKSS